MHPISIDNETGEVFSANPGLDPEEFQEEFCRQIGLPETIPATTAVDQIIGDLIERSPENSEKINWYLAFIVAQRPKSLLEAQLLAQLLASHQLCTRMLKRASKENWPEGIDKFTNIAIKLSRAYRQGLETLAKYRRDGKQTIFIERVNVEKDAHALFGTVERG